MHFGRLLVDTLVKDGAEEDLERAAKALVAGLLLLFGLGGGGVVDRLRGRRCRRQLVHVGKDVEARLALVAGFHLLVGVGLRLDLLKKDAATHYLADSLVSAYIEDETRQVEKLSSQVAYFKDRLGSCRNELDGIKETK